MSEFRDLIDKISKISDGVKRELKPLIQSLAKEIGDNLNRSDISNLAKLHGIEDPDEKDVTKILNGLRKKYEWSFSENSLYNYVQPKYKSQYKEAKEYENPVRITALLKDPEKLQSLKEQIKEAERKFTPAKDIITKARVPDMEKYTWKCHLAEELAMLAIKMEKEHEEKHEDKLCKEYSKRAKMVRDSRFATDANSYEAIILAINSTQSLKNAISGEWEFKTVWEIKEDEENCRECIKENCKSEKCKHECHRVVRPMTTKGLKYAIKTNEDLKSLDNQIKRLSEIENDICKIGKMLLENPKTKKLLGVKDIRKLMFNHIERDDCLQCDMFIEKNPNFFKQSL